MVSPSWWEAHFLQFLGFDTVTSLSVHHRERTGQNLGHHLEKWTFSTASKLACVKVATVVLLGLAIFITFVVTSVLDILAFIGGLAAVSLMFVFPGLIYARAVGRTRMFAERGRFTAERSCVR